MTFIKQQATAQLRTQAATTATILQADMNSSILKTMDPQTSQAMPQVK
jgi:hypothetical protein